MCPTLVKQLETTVKQVAKEAVLDKLAPGQVHDVLDTCEYYAGFEPTFLSPPPGPAISDPGQAMFDSDKKFLDGIFKLNKKNDTRGPIVLGMP
jgi:hypothetical protein